MNSTRHDEVHKKINRIDSACNEVNTAMANTKDELRKLKDQAMGAMALTKECNVNCSKISLDLLQSKINLIAQHYEFIMKYRNEWLNRKINFVADFEAQDKEVKSVGRELAEIPYCGNILDDLLNLLHQLYGSQVKGMSQKFILANQLIQLKNATDALITMCDKEIPTLFSVLKTQFPSLKIPSLTPTTKNMPAPSAPPQELVEQKEQYSSKASVKPLHMQYNARAEGEPENREPGQSAGSTSYQYEQKEQQSAAAPVRYTGAGVQTTAVIMGRLPAQAPQQGAGVFAHHPAPSAPVQSRVQPVVTSIPKAASFYTQFRLQYNAKKQASMLASQQTRSVVA